MVGLFSVSSVPCYARVSGAQAGSRLRFFDFIYERSISSIRPAYDHLVHPPSRTFFFVPCSEPKDPNELCSIMYDTSRYTVYAQTTSIHCTNTADPKKAQALAIVVWSKIFRSWTKICSCRARISVLGPICDLTPFAEVTPQRSYRKVYSKTTTKRGKR